MNEPHESAAILRMSRAGLSAPMICKVLRLSKEQYFLEAQLALDDETAAINRGVPVYDDKIIVCPRCGGEMFKDQSTPFFRCPVDHVAIQTDTKH